MRRKIDNNWRITNESGLDILGNVPGDITADLYKAGIIKEPCFGMNHKELGWIIESDFTYCTSFDLDDDILQSDEIILTFSGIDTYSEIYLNEQFLGNTQNMFLQYEYNVKEIVRKENNVLKVKMLSTKQKMSKIDTEGYFGIFNIERLFVRKAQCHFGWDWAPNMPGYGIYKSVWITGRNKRHIDDVSYRAYKDGNLQFSVDLSYDVRPTVDYYGKPIETIPDEFLNTYLRYTIATTPGVEIEKLDMNHVEIYEQKVNSKKNFANFRIDNPQLWWPSGYGEQPMYCYRIEVMKNGQVLDTKEGNFAIREVRLEQKPIEIERLECKIVLNDVPIFAKGSNWVPAECFVGEMKKDKYEKLLSLAKNANMNMLRVWGGGVYEDDVFYDICDRLGIMVWQDMMFACADIPEEKQEFVDNVREEVTYQIKRLRGHPAIVLWSGGNEKVGATCKQVSHGDYFMEVILRGMITNLDDSRPFVKQSPYSMTELGNDVSSGDSHVSAFELSLIEGVEGYRDYVSASVASFVSECALMGPGSLESVKKMFPQDKVWPMNEFWDDRLMDNPYGVVDMTFAEKQRQYANALYGESKSIESFICKGMTAHAETMRAELEYARNNKGLTWGFMNWMYSDSWPSGNWSVVDYYCEPKQVYYQMKRSFAPVLLTYVQNSTYKTVLSIVNDTAEDVTGEISYGLKTLEGNIIWEKNVSVEVPENGVLHIDVEDEFKIANTYLYAKGVLNRQEYSTVYSYNMWSDAQFESDYHYAARKEAELMIVTIQANKFAKGITLRLPDNTKYIYSDNYFDLEGGQERTIVITGTKDVHIEDLIVTDFAKEIIK